MTSLAQEPQLRARTRLRVGTATALAAVCLGAGIALRAWLLASSQGALDGDEAVWGLMARHLLHGEWSTFYWGQAYGGTQETVVTAALFWLVGPSVTALKLVPILFWAGATALLWRVGRRTLGEPRARLAAGLFWAWPVFFVWKSTRAHGFYGAGLVFGLWAMLAALRLAERESKLELAALGLALGLGWWATPQVAILGLPAVLWLVARRPRLLRETWVALPAFLVGSLPWWVDNARHGWPSLHLGSGNSGSTLGHLHNLASATLPTALGLRLPFSLSWFPDLPVGVVVYACALAWFAWLLVRRPPRLGLPLVALLVFPVLYAVSPYTWLDVEPRYLTLLAPVLVLLVASVARSRTAAVALVAACLALSFGGFARYVSGNLTASHSGGVALPASFDPLVRTLEREHVRHLYADYWIAYPIDFVSHERIVAAKSGAQFELVHGRVRANDTGDQGSQGRYPRYNRVVDASRDAALVFTRGGSFEPHALPLLRHARYRLVRTGVFDVWLPPRT